MTFERKPEEIIKDVLARWSVADLREQSNEDLSIGDERFYKATSDMKVTAQGKTGLIDWWQIESNGKPYECRRFKNFVFCSCKSFFFSKKMCKHLAITTRVYCANCFELSAKVGKLCYDCDQKINHWMRPAIESTWTPLCSAKF